MESMLQLKYKDCQTFFIPKFMLKIYVNKGNFKHQNIERIEVKE